MPGHVRVFIATSLDGFIAGPDDAGLIDELIITVVPVILGAGASLFAGIEQRRELVLVSSETLDQGLVQLRYRLDAP